jgi:hypothetical protein
MNARLSLLAALSLVLSSIAAAQQCRLYGSCEWSESVGSGMISRSDPPTTLRLSVGRKRANPDDCPMWHIIEGGEPSTSARKHMRAPPTA